ncbi:MAG: UDP-N-acetylmuramoyl-tripeptide--D-alanyl-D-alanine ligase [Deinococcota bacterium]|nr:UDP-N-acetylmuramoyl-tripeptide--D-alanyl-D-alanine ligase [Deinococcota bacterium]
MSSQGDGQRDGQKAFPSAGRAQALLQAHRLASFGVRSATALPDASGVSFHSGRVKPGDAFFALPGEHGHGIAFADAALEKGAAFIVSDRPHPRGIVVADPKALLLQLGKEARGLFSGAVVGITGSAGKTSTKAMVAATLGAYASPGNFNTPLALAQTLIETALQQEAQGAPRRALVLEMGIDQKGEMDGLVALVKPTHAVLTLVGESHLSGLGTVEDVAYEKGKLLKSAPVALMHALCRGYYPDLALGKTPERVYTYGLDEEPCEEDAVSFCGRVLTAGPDRQTLEVFGVRLSLPYPGRHMAANAVAAMSLAKLLNEDLHGAAARLERVRLEPGRLEVKERPGLTIIDDSYNSNPASAALALEALAKFPRPHTAILGDMLELGERSGDLHRLLGERARAVDALLTVGLEARAVAQGHPEAKHFDELEGLLASLKSHRLRGTVLVKGSRGMRLERVVSCLEADLKTDPETNNATLGAGA